MHVKGLSHFLLFLMSGQEEGDRHAIST